MKFVSTSVLSIVASLVLYVECAAQATECEAQCISVYPDRSEAISCMSGCGWSGSLTEANRIPKDQLSDCVYACSNVEISPSEVAECQKRCVTQRTAPRHHVVIEDSP